MVEPSACASLAADRAPGSSATRACSSTTLLQLGTCDRLDGPTFDQAAPAAKGTGLAGKILALGRSGYHGGVRF